MLFDRVADIPIEKKVPNNLFEYNETLESGFSYVYKVTIYNRSKISGNDSNFVKFRFPVSDSENNTLMEKKE